MSVSSTELAVTYTHQLGMTTLHTLLIAEGWEIVAADADAIGSGSLANPAWDKTPVVNSDAGVVVYRMAATPMTTQWYVRLRPRWASGIDRFGFYSQVATGWDGSNLSGIVGTETGASTSTAAADSGGNTYISASPEGFVMVGNASGRAIPFAAFLANNQDGTISDDIVQIHMNLVASVTGHSGYSHVAARGICRTTDASGVHGDRALVFLGELASVSAFRHHFSLSDGPTSELPVGPMLFSKRYTGFCPHLVWVPQSRFAPGDTFEMIIGARTLVFTCLPYDAIRLGTTPDFARVAIRTA
jgi:hypothetical protein